MSQKRKLIDTSEDTSDQEQALQKQKVRGFRIASQQPKHYSDAVPGQEDEFAQADEALDPAEVAEEERCSEEEALPSVLLGPRLPAEAPPGQLCCFWLLHPAFCEQADNCPMAHGLAELGVTFGDAVEIRTDCCTTMSVQPIEPNGKAAARVVPPRAGIGKAASAAAPQEKPHAQNSKDWKAARPSLPALPAQVPGYTMAGKGASAAAWAPQHAPAQGPQQNRFAGGNFMPNRICNFWLKNPSLCARGMECSFAHGVQELQPSAVASCGVSRFHHMRWPTKFCTFFSNGSCTRGLGCTFAHSPDELQVYG